jgi:hypothetical protein
LSEFLWKIAGLWFGLRQARLEQFGFQKGNVLCSGIVNSSLLCIFTGCKTNIKAMLEILKKSLPWLTALVVFVVLSVAYFSPVLDGKQLPQMDEIHAKGMAKELVDYEQQTGQKSMWTNSMFGGMPAYQIKGDSSANIFAKFNQATRLGLPFYTIAIVFLYMMGFYLLLLSLKVDKWLSIVGAVAFAFGSYNLIIIVAGHITKAYAIALMPVVLAGILYAYNRNKIVGAIFTAVALGMEIAYNHVQITYYLALLIGVMVVTKAVYAYLNKQLPEFAKTSALLGIAVVLAILPNIGNLITTAEYGQYSIRGKSELNSETGKESGGLDKDYALAWSYGQKETWTLMIPNVVGGASESFAAAPDALEHVDEQLKEVVSQQSQYWGGRPFTSGPVYIGAIICYLFFIGAFLYKGPERWWLIAGTVLSLFLAWGKNFGWFTDFMFYYFPLYNKFRTVEMALVIASVTMPILAFLGLKEIYDRPEIVKLNIKWFALAFGLTGGLSLLFYLMPTAFFDFISADELQSILQQKSKAIAQNPQYGAMYDGFIAQLKGAREGLLKADAIRSFFFVTLASGSLWFFSTNKLSTSFLTGGLAILIIIDLWSVDKRYLNNDMFQSQSRANQFEETISDKAILKDSDPYYRVFTLYRNPFNDAYTSYFHKSIGGYHGAKLRRYQDVIDRYLMRDWQMLGGQLQKGYNDGAMSLLAQTSVTNMLNAKYVVYIPNVEPIKNPYAFGNAWFVSQVKVAGDANEELDLLGQVDLRNTAVIAKPFASNVNGYALDTVMGSLQLTSYAPDVLKYKSVTNQNQLAVFSEIYYPKGWNAYVDGQPTDIMQVNYILRGIMLPKGAHDIEFRFEPKSFQLGKTIAYIGSLLVLMAVAFALYLRWKKHKAIVD